MRNKELFRGRRKAGRIVGLVLTLALAVSLLSGCGQSKERLTFGTGGTAGTYYSYGGVLAQYITNNTNVKVTAVSYRWFQRRTCSQYRTEISSLDLSSQM